MNVVVLDNLLQKWNYNESEREFVVQGFQQGFDIGYRGPINNIRRFAPNLKLHVGNETILWNKVMKEVKLGRYAEPFKEPPFENFIQSPIGLVPKSNGNTRLIFHLSYPRNGDSVNSLVPHELCSVKYPDFADAVRMCMKIIHSYGSCSIAKLNMLSAFRNLARGLISFV